MLIINRIEVINFLNANKKYAQAETVEEIKAQVAIKGERWFDYIPLDDLKKALPTLTDLIESKVVVKSVEAEHLIIRR